MLCDDDLIRRQIIEQLLRNFRLSFRDLEGRFDIQSDEYFKGEAERLESLRGDGLFHRSENGLAVLSIGQVFSRNLAKVLDVHLKEPGLAVKYSTTA